MGTTLHDIDAGQTFDIEAVDDDEIRAQLLRMGFLDGTVECRRHLTKGPVVIERRGTELALGAPIAKQIDIVVR